MRTGGTKKSPDGRSEAAIGADQPGMGMTDRVYLLREKSRERLRRSQS